MVMETGFFGSMTVVMEHGGSMTMVMEPEFGASQMK